MTVVYIDEVFALNAVMDYLLLLSSARLAGEELRRGRMILGAVLGGLYAAASLLPGWGYLGHPLCKLAMGVALPLAAFGGSKRLLRVSLIFFGVSATFGGGVLALQLWMGAPAIPDLKTLLLAAAGCYGLLTLVFHRGLRHTGGELASARLTLGERTCRLTALVDTGNTLTDPVTGRPVMVVEGERLSGLFPSGECPTARELSDPVSALERRGGKDGRWRLLPYRAVGVSHALLLAVRVDGARIGGEDYGPLLVALSPTPVSDGGGYSALIGA